MNDSGNNGASNDPNEDQSSNNKNDSVNGNNNSDNNKNVSEENKKKKKIIEVYGQELLGEFDKDNNIANVPEVFLNTTNVYNNLGDNFNKRMTVDFYEVICSFTDEIKIDAFVPGKPFNLIREPQKVVSNIGFIIDSYKKIQRYQQFFCENNPNYCSQIEESSISKEDDNGKPQKHNKFVPLNESIIKIIDCIKSCNIKYNSFIKQMMDTATFNNKLLKEYLFENISQPKECFYRSMYGFGEKQTDSDEEFEHLNDLFMTTFNQIKTIHIAGYHGPSNDQDLNLTICLIVICHLFYYFKNDPPNILLQYIHGFPLEFAYKNENEFKTDLEVVKKQQMLLKKYGIVVANEQKIQLILTNKNSENEIKNNDKSSSKNIRYKFTNKIILTSLKNSKYLIKILNCIKEQISMKHNNDILNQNSCKSNYNFTSHDLNNCQLHKGTVNCGMQGNSCASSYKNVSFQNNTSGINTSGNFINNSEKNILPINNSKNNVISEHFVSENNTNHNNHSSNCGFHNFTEQRIKPIKSAQNIPTLNNNINDIMKTQGQDYLEMVSNIIKIMEKLRYKVKILFNSKDKFAPDVKENVDEINKICTLIQENFSNDDLSKHKINLDNPENRTLELLRFLNDYFLKEQDPNQQEQNNTNDIIKVDGGINNQQILPTVNDVTNAENRYNYNSGNNQYNAKHRIAIENSFKDDVQHLQNNINEIQVNQGIVYLNNEQHLERQQPSVGNSHNVGVHQINEYNNFEQSNNLLLDNHEHDKNNNINFQNDSVVNWAPNYNNEGTFNNSNINNVPQFDESQKEHLKVNDFKDLREQYTYHCNQQQFISHLYRHYGGNSIDLDNIQKYSYNFGLRKYQDFCNDKNEQYRQQDKVNYMQNNNHQNFNIQKHNIGQKNMNYMENNRNMGINFNNINRQEIQNISYNKVSSQHLENNQVSEFTNQNYHNIQQNDNNIHNIHNYHQTRDEISLYNQNQNNDHQIQENVVNMHNSGTMANHQEEQRYFEPFRSLDSLKNIAFEEHQPVPTRGSSSNLPQGNYYNSYHQGSVSNNIQNIMVDQQRQNFNDQENYARMNYYQNGNIPNMEQQHYDNGLMMEFNNSELQQPSNNLQRRFHQQEFHEINDNFNQNVVTNQVFGLENDSIEVLAANNIPKTISNKIESSSSSRDSKLPCDFTMQLNHQLQSNKRKQPSIDENINSSNIPAKIQRFLNKNNNQDQIELSIPDSLQNQKIFLQPSVEVSDTSASNSIRSKSLRSLASRIDDNIPITYDKTYSKDNSSLKPLIVKKIGNKLPKSKILKGIPIKTSKKELNEIITITSNTSTSPPQFTNHETTNFKYV